MTITMRKTASAFTLVELLVYIGLLGLFLSAIYPFALGLFGLSAKAQAMRETSSAARIIGEEIVSVIRSAKDIDTGASDFGTNPGRLVLKQYGSDERLVIDVADGRVRMTDGAGIPVSLNGSSVRVTSLVFENASSSDGSSRHVDFHLTVEFASGSSRSEYVSAVSIAAGAEIRNNDI